MMEGSRSPRGGSYELYENQRAIHSSGDGRGRASPAIAPGCPGTPQDMQQMVEDLRKEISDLKGREDNLLQIIGELRGPHNKVSSGNFGNSPTINAEAISGASGSPVHESQEEKVKDARINHLERQVTVLQANVFKADGWANRVEEAHKERDQAIDECRTAFTGLQQSQDQCQALHREVANLESCVAELKGRLRQAVGDLEQERSKQERSQAQQAKLQQDLVDTRTELTTFKESVRRLSHENNLLKENAAESKQKASQTSAPSQNGQSSSLGCSRSGSPACTQELGYLHHVVDTLKSTVLEQRSFLLNMKVPQSLPLSTSPQRSNKAGPRGDVADLSQPILQAVMQNTAHPQAGTLGPAASDPHVVTTTTPANVAGLMGGRHNGVVAAAGSVVVMNGRGDEVRGHAAAPTFVTPGVVAPRKREGSAPQRLMQVTQRRQPQGVPLSMNQRTLEGGPPVPSRPVVAGGQEATKQPLQPTYSAPVQRKVASEIQARRPLSEATPVSTHAKTDFIVRQPLDKEGVLMDGKVYPKWMFATAGQSTQTTPGLEHFQTAVPSVGLGASGVRVHASHFEAAPILPGEAQYVLANARMASPAHRPQTAGPQLLQQQQTLVQALSSPVRNNSNHAPVATSYGMGEAVGRTGVQHIKGEPPTSCQASPSAQRRPEVGLAWAEGASGSPQGHSKALLGKGLTDVGPAAVPPHLNADRLCPVCNRNFGQLSMEEFQTHVFECFDDENAPETMKATELDGSSPQAPTEGDRFCPMCNTRFGQGTQQAEYEKHVHGHFGEELTGENFEILNP